MPDSPGHNGKNSGRLSAEESVELAAQLAELGRSGLRLPEGLRAAAGELPGRKLPETMRQIAADLERGEALDRVLADRSRRLPADLRGMVLAGVRSGHVVEVLEEFVDLKRERIELRRRIWAALAYPLLLLVMMAVLFLFLKIFVVGQMAAVFEDFEAELPTLTEFFLWFSDYAGWALLVLAGLFGAGGAMLITLGRLPWVARAQYLVPLVGPLWRYSRLSQIARTVRLLLVEGVPLDEALRTAGDGLPDGYLRRGCRRVAAEVESGRPLSECLADAEAFPASMVPLIEWGEANNSLAGAFEAIAEALDGRVQSHDTLIGSVVLPVVFLLVVGFVGTMFVALLMPMISLIQRLT